jgi:DNA primase
MHLIKSRVDYPRAFLQHFPGARVRNNRIQVICPIPSHGHSGRGNPGLSIDLQRGLFHCFSRNEGGDLIRFYELMNGISFPQAVRRLAEDVGISPLDTSIEQDLFPEVHECASAFQSPAELRVALSVYDSFVRACRREDQSEGIQYLAARGISLRTFVDAGITYFPRSAYRRIMGEMKRLFTRAELKQSGLFNEENRLTFYRHRLIFPFYSEGLVVYLQARTTLPGFEPRWHNLRGSVPSLYNVDLLSRLESRAVVYLVEGFTDTLTLMSHRFNAVGIVGAGGLKEEWLPLLGRFKVVALLDNDHAGNANTARYQELFAQRRLTLARVRLNTDVNEYFSTNPAAGLELELMTETALEDPGEARFPSPS